MALTESIQQAFDAEAETPISDMEAASLRFQTSQDMADIIASLDDHDDAAIGRMVRDGFRKHLRKVSHMRRMNAAFSDIHGGTMDDLEEMDSNGRA